MFFFPGSPVVSSSRILFMEDLLHMTEEEIECVPRIFHTSVFDFVASAGFFILANTFVPMCFLSSGICR